MELIKIGSSIIGDGLKETVNARDLHSFLEIKGDFTDWIKNQIERARLVENIDFIVFLNNQEKGRPRTDYYLTIESAKSIGMMSGTDKGFEIRNYFIECERRLISQQSSNPLIQLANAVILANKMLEEQTLFISDMKPKIEFYDTVMTSNDTIDMASVAKVLNMGIGRNRLFSLLREKDILQANNHPYQKYVDSGYFKVTESKYIKPNGDICITLKTVVYQKGLDYIRKIVSES